MNPPEGYEFGTIGRDNQFAISPDGSAIAFVAEGQRKQLLFVRMLSSGTTQPLQGTDGASYPFWSGDGRNLAFFADGKVKRIPATGGVVQVLCDAPAGRGGTWNQSGVIVFTPGLKEPLYKIPDSGGTPAAVTAVKTIGRTTKAIDGLASSPTATLFIHHGRWRGRGITGFNRQPRVFTGEVQCRLFQRIYSLCYGRKPGGPTV